MAIASPNAAASTTTAPSGQSYGAPLATVTTLFFMWGFLTCLNDILVPHLKSIFDLNYTRVMLIQFAFFGAYFIFSIPSAKIIDAIGYQRSMVVGLLTMGVGAFLFVPAASVPSYPLFLGALIVLAAGITCLQVAANPYVTVLGKPETASSRLNLTQAFNSLGTFLAPFFGALLILSSAPKTMDEIRAMAPADALAYRLHEAASVKTPYVGLGIALVLLAVAIGSFKLPKIEHAQHKVGQKVDDSIWRHPNLIFGAIAIFVYVGAEVSIGSFLVNYFAQPEIGGLTEKVAASFVAFYWGGAMVGRFIGSALLQKMKTGALLGICAVCAAGLVAISMLTIGAFRDVQHYPGGFLQLDHVPQYLHFGGCRTRTAYRRWLRHHDHGNRGRRDHPCGAGMDRRSHRHSSRFLPPGNLLSVHFVLCTKRLEAKQPALRQGLVLPLLVNPPQKAKEKSLCAGSLTKSLLRRHIWE